MQEKACESQWKCDIVLQVTSTVSWSLAQDHLTSLSTVKWCMKNTSNTKHLFWHLSYTVRPLSNNNHAFFFLIRPNIRFSVKNEEYGCDIFTLAKLTNLNLNAQWIVIALFTNSFYVALFCLFIILVRIIQRAIQQIKTCQMSVAPGYGKRNIYKDVLH